MDGRHFDDMVRSLSAAGSRRGLLRLLSNLPIAGLLIVVSDAPKTVATVVGSTAITPEPTPRSRMTHAQRHPQ